MSGNALSRDLPDTRSAPVYQETCEAGTGWLYCAHAGEFTVCRCACTCTTQAHCPVIA